jgi:putative tryptophan/tyrosine transport system substrate-binding protein
MHGTNVSPRSRPSSFGVRSLRLSRQAPQSLQQSKKPRQSRSYSPLLRVRVLQEAARARGVELAVHLVERPERIGPQIEEARRAGAETLNVLASPILYARRLDIFERTAALRLPAMYQSPEFAEEGGLIGYGPRITQMFRQLARQLAKIFSSEKVSDVPVEQPTRFELAINLQAAKAIGFEVPPSLVLRADKVIE